MKILEDDDESVKSAADRDDSVSADNDDCDLEELASVENDGEDLEQDDDDDDTSANDDDEQLEAEDIFSSDMPTAAVGDSRDVGKSSVSGNDVGTGEDIVSLTASVDHVNISERSEDTRGSGTQTDVPVDEFGSQSEAEKPLVTAEEFPDTSIDLQHISGSKFVPLFLLVLCNTLYFISTYYLHLTTVII